MNYVWAVLRREVKSYFVSPLAYTAIAVFLVMQGVLFVLSLIQYEDLRLSAAQDPMLDVPTADVIIRAVVGDNMIWALLLIVPLLTMRLLAEERRQHTAELLLTAPMTTRQLVLGKFLGSAVVLAVMLGLTAWIPLLLQRFGGIDMAPVVSGYLGAFLYGAVLLALGLMASSLTDSPMIAAFLSLIIIALVNVAGVMAPQVPIIGQNLERLTPSTNLLFFARGVIELQPLVFFVSAILLVLDLTARIVDSQRWR